MRKLVLLAGSVLAGISLIGPLQGAASAQTGKLVVIVLENEPYASIAGNSQAPYLNQLIAQGELFTNYAGVADGSNPNYLAMTSGLTSALSPTGGEHLPGHRRLGRFGVMEGVHGVNARQLREWQQRKGAGYQRGAVYRRP